MKSIIYNPFYSNSWALIIGIDKYKNASNLEYAVNDSKEIANILIKKFNFPSDNVIQIYDEKATYDNILSSFLSFKDLTQKNDRIIIFYAGHGYTTSGNRGEIGFLIPYDGETDNLSKSIRWDQFTLNSELIPAKHILYIMDACYSGLAITRNLRPGSIRFLNDMLQRFTRQVLTAGKANEVVADSGGPIPKHSVFTGHLIQALNSNAYTNDGILTANGVMAYVYEKVSKDYKSNQTPHFGFLEGDGDFIFDGPNIFNESLNAEVNNDIFFEIPPTLLNNEIIDDNNIINQTKEYLSEKKYSIKLHDLVTQKLREVHSILTTDSFNYNNSKIDRDEFVDRLKFYEALINEIKIIISCLSYWGSNETTPLITKIFSRLLDHIDLKNGTVLWLNLRYYPSLLTFYSSGISAIAANRYDLLYSIMYNYVSPSKIYGEKKEYVLSLYNEISEIEKSFKLIPNHEKNFFPMSEYIHKILQPALDDLFYLGRDYENYFDIFEIFLALVHADLIYQKKGFIYGPFGRFAWKYKHSDNSNFNQMGKDADKFLEDWQPFKYGFFNGSYERFKKIYDDYESSISKMALY